MSATSVPFNPAATTNLAGLFSVQAAGLFQGVFLDDPAVRYQMNGGVLASTESLPMWGGVGIYEDIPVGGFNALGSTVGRAADFAHLTGFSVFNQEGGWINSPQSPVPVGLLGGQVNFFRFGSNAKIVVACDPALASLDAGLITQQVSWDYTNQKLIAYDSAHALPVKVLSIQTSGCKTVSYDGTSGNATWANSANACAIIQL